MKTEIENICVFCASSQNCHTDYLETSSQLGNLIAQHKWKLIYGGGQKGCMGALADATLESQGNVHGIIPNFMHQLGWSHSNLTTLDIVTSMSERKERMLQLADAIVVLPGGSGTLEEFFEVLSAKRLGQFLGPIVLVNTRQFFDPLIQILNSMIDEKFLNQEHRKMWSCVQTIEDVPGAIRNTTPWSSQAIDFAGA